MKPDSITPYHRDSSHSPFQEGQSAPYRSQRSNNLPKDVLESLDKGNLDEALARLKELDAQQEQASFFFQLLVKMRRGFRLTLEFPFLALSKLMAKGVRKQNTSMTKDHEILRKSENEKRVGQALEKIHVLALSMITNSVSALQKAASLMGNGIKGGADWFSQKVSQKTQPLTHVIQEAVKNTLAAILVISRAIAVAYESLQRLGKKIEENIKENVLKATAYVFKPIEAWSKRVLEPLWHKVKNAVVAVVEEQVNRMVYFVDRTWQVTVVVVSPFILIGQQASEWCWKTAVYRMLQVQKFLERGGAWLSDKAQNFLREVSRYVTPVIRFIGGWIYWFVDTLLEWIGRFLIWVWRHLVIFLEHIPEMLLMTLQGAWIVMKILPALCFAALVGIFKGISLALLSPFRRKS